MIRGSCLCGGVRFEIAKAAGPFELCHCNRCPKASGSAFAASLGVESADYRLLSGAELIASYDAPILRAPPAYRSSFCRRCGSPVPDPEPSAKWFELPAGLLEGDPGLRPDKPALIFEGFAADAEVMRFLGWRPHASLAAAEAALARRLERLANGVEYSWVIEPSATRGAAGLISGWREEDALELGFVLVRSCWGQGFASEAAAAVAGWALGTGAIRSVWATCDAENTRSARALQKAGFDAHGLHERGIVRPNLGSEPRPSLHFSRER